MKKVFIWLVLTLISISMIAGLSFTGCKKAEVAATTVEEETTTTEAKEETAEETTAETVDPASFKGEIDLMAFNDEFDVQGPNGEPTMIEMFNEVYPNITVNFTKVPSGEIAERLESTFSAGAGIPDVFVGEQAWVLRWIVEDVWENLSAAPYNAEELTADQFSYVKDFVRDADGNLRGLTFQATPGAIFYRRSIAQEALGVSEPDDVSALMSTWDGYIEMGKTIKEKTGAYLLAGPRDIQRLFFFAKKQPWVVDGKLVIEPIVLDYLDKAKEIRDAGLDAGALTWSPEWSAGMNTNVFTYVLPTWGLFFVIEPNITEPAEPVKGIDYSFGDWGLAHGPASYMWGGTWLGISKTSEKKDLAWEFVKFITTDKDFLKSWAELRGDVTSDMKVDEEVAATASRESLGGQNHMQYFLDEAKKLDTSGWATRVTQYDEDIQNAFMDALGDYVDGNTTRDEAIQAFKDAVAALYPEITVE
jgi:ABC-type glycerol-3-phosphate transport system substrate-binding protein